MPRQAVTETVDQNGHIVKTVSVPGHAPVDITVALGALDTDNLVGEARTVGAHAVYFGVLYAEAMANQRRAKLRVEVTKATLGRRIRREAVRDSAKTTERSIEEDVLLSPEYQTAEHAHIDAEETADILRSVSYTAEQKHRTITALMAQVNRELAARAPVTREEMRAGMQDEPRGGRRTPA